MSKPVVKALMCCVVLVIAVTVTEYYFPTPWWGLALTQWPGGAVLGVKCAFDEAIE